MHLFMMISFNYILHRSVFRAIPESSSCRYSYIHEGIHEFINAFRKRKDTSKIGIYVTGNIYILFVYAHPQLFKKTFAPICLFIQWFGICCIIRKLTLNWLSNQCQCVQWAWVMLDLFHLAGVLIMIMKRAILSNSLQS